MAALVRRLLVGRRQEQAVAARWAYLTRLVAAFDQVGLPVLPLVRRGAVVVPGLVEPLSARELEVLQLLAAGKPNRLIAEELVVTLETVKKHVSHVFDKLGLPTAPRPSPGRRIWGWCPNGTGTGCYHVRVPPRAARHGTSPLCFPLA
jgi:LuxR family maltose regulon positive regulatory protein